MNNSVGVCRVNIMLLHMSVRVWKHNTELLNYYDMLTANLDAKIFQRAKVLKEVVMNKAHVVR